MLGFEPKEYGIMDEKPKSLQEPILGRLGLSLIGVISVSSSIAALLAFGYFLRTQGNPALGRSFVFASFAVNSMVYIFCLPEHASTHLRSGSLMHTSPWLSQWQPACSWLLSLSWCLHSETCCSSCLSPWGSGGWFLPSPSYCSASSRLASSSAIVVVSPHEHSSKKDRDGRLSSVPIRGALRAGSAA